MKTLMALTNNEMATDRLTALITDRKLTLFSELQYTALSDCSLEALLDFVFVEKFGFYIENPGDVCIDFANDTALRVEVRDALEKHSRYLGTGDFRAMDIRAEKCARQVLAATPQRMAA